MTTLTLNTVTFLGNGPFNGEVLEFRYGTVVIGTAVIPGFNTTVTFSGASKTVSGTDNLKVYYQTGGPSRGTFVSSIDTGKYGPGTIQATAAVYGAGMLTLSYTVS